MNIEMFNKKFRDMELWQKALALILIPAVIIIALGVTAKRRITNKKP